MKNIVKLKVIKLLESKKYGTGFIALNTSSQSELCLFGILNNIELEAESLAFLLAKDLGVDLDISIKYLKFYSKNKSILDVFDKVFSAYRENSQIFEKIYMEDLDKEQTLSYQDEFII